MPSAASAPPAPIASVAYQARLLGMLRLEHQGAELALPATVGGRHLLAYLLLYRQQPHARSHLVGQFWPEFSERQARRALSQAVWQINQCLPGLLQAKAHRLSISPQFPLQVDVPRFEALAQPHLQRPGRYPVIIQDLSQAVEWYGGDLLLDCYADWVVLERARLREIYLQTLELLASAYKATARYEAGLQIALQLVGLDPLRESAQREVMRLFHALGRPEAALHQFELCRASLQAELGLEPDTETLALAQAIAQRTPSRPAVHLPAPPLALASNYPIDATALPLVGRAEERTELLRLIDPLYEGHGGIILVEGEAGVGKTRLLQEVGRDAEWRGAQVLWGKATEQAGQPLYGPLMEALASGLSPLRLEQLLSLLQPLWRQVLHPFLPSLAGEELPALPPLVSGHGLDRLVAAVGQLLTAWAQVKPLLLVLEDLHWAGEDLLEVILRLAPALNPVGVFIIGSYRTDEVQARPLLWQKLKALDPTELRGRLELVGLNATDTGNLIRTGLGGAPTRPHFEVRLHHETGGNPLFLLETLRSLRDEGQLQQNEAGEWDLAEATLAEPALPLPAAVEQVIARRVALLPPALHDRLNLLAVLGGRFDFALLTALEIGSPPAWLADLHELVRRRLLVEGAREYHFSHDKVSQVVYASLTAADRQRLHSQVACQIERQHPDWVETLAYHFTQGQMWAPALRYHKQAAQLALTASAYAAARQHLDTAQHAAGQLALSPEERFDLLAAHEAVLDILGDRSAQAIALAALLQCARADPLLRAQALGRQTEFLTTLSQYDEAEAAASEALALAQSQANKSAQAAALLALGIAINRRGQPKRAIPHLREAVALCQTESNLLQQARAHYILASTLSFYEQYAEAQVEAELALRLYESLADQRGQAQALGTLGVIGIEVGAIDAAIAYYARSLQITRAIGCRYEEARALINLGVARGLTGQVAQSMQCYTQARDLFRALGDRRLENLAHLNLAATRHYILGEDDAAWADLQAGLAEHIKTGDSARHEFIGTLGDIARCRGDLKTARTYLEASIAGALESGRLWGVIQSYDHLIHLDLDEANPAQALKDLETAEAICKKSALANWEVRLLDLRGVVCLALGQPQAALAATRQAMAQLKPEVERGYLIPFHHYQALAALGHTAAARAASEQAYRSMLEVLADLTPAQRQTSLERVPEHRALWAAWQANQPRQRTLLLPRAEVPIGRPLRDDEWVTVIWTLAAVEDEQIPGKVARRRRRLLRLLHEAAAQGAAPTYAHLAEALEISLRTLAQDMAVLRQTQPHLPRTRHTVARPAPKIAE